MELNKDLARLFHWLGIDVPLPLMYVIAVVAIIAIAALVRIVLK